MGFPRQEYWRSCHLLLQGIFLTQGLNLCLQCLLRWQVDSLLLSHQRNRPSSWKSSFFFFFAMPHSLWDLSSPTETESRSSANRAPSPNHRTIREFPKVIVLMEWKQITSFSYFSKHLPTSLSWRLYEEGTLLKVNYFVNLLTNCFVLNSLVCFD